MGNLRGWLADGRPALRREFTPVVADVVIHRVPLWVSLSEVRAKLGVVKTDSRKFFVASNGDAYTYDVDVVGVVGQDEQDKWRGAMVELDEGICVSVRWTGRVDANEWDW